MKNEERRVPEQALIASLRDSQLKEVQLDRQTLSVSLHFTSGPEAQGIVLTLQNTVHVVISKDPDDEELPAVVGEATLVSLQDGGASVLTKLKYPFRKIDDSAAVFTYQDKRLYYFHLEGDVCCDVVCANYQIRRTENAEKVAS